MNQQNIVSFLNPLHTDKSKFSSKNRNIDFFYTNKSTIPSVFNLPPYVELYYQIFNNIFISSDEESKRYIYLCWLITSINDTNFFDLEVVQNDQYILNLLNNIQLEISASNFKIAVSKFHYYYYLKNYKSFLSWHFNLDSELDYIKLIIWYYTYGINMSKIYFLNSSLSIYLKISKNINLNFFDITFIFELLLIYKLNYNYISDDVNQSLLYLYVSNIIFNYSSHQYPLSTIQINQLFDFKENGLLVIEFFWLNYQSQLDNSNYDISFQEMDIHPDIKIRLIGFHNQFFDNIFIPIYLFKSFFPLVNAYPHFSILEVQFIFLTWFFINEDISFDPGLSKKDSPIFILLNKKFSFDNNDEFFENFHYYYYLHNKELFDSLKLSIDTFEERVKYLKWCYTIGVDVYNINYFNITKEDYIKFMADSGMNSNF